MQGQTALLVDNETQKCGFLRPSLVRGWLLVLLMVRMGDAGVRELVTHLEIRARRKPKEVRMRKIWKPCGKVSEGSQVRMREKCKCEEGAQSSLFCHLQPWNKTSSNVPCRSRLPINSSASLVIMGRRGSKRGRTYQKI